MPIYHGRDLRRGRYSQPGRPYLVTTVVKGRERLFEDFWLARLLVAELRETTEQELVESLAWVIMPDHLHWLLVPKRASLQTVMRRMKSRSAVAINRVLGRSGPIWQKGYHDRNIRNELELNRYLDYIRENPVKAGYVKDPEDWPWTEMKLISYAAPVTGDEPWARTLTAYGIGTLAAYWCIRQAWVLY